MSIAIATTRIDVVRPASPPTEDPYGDGYDEPADRDDSETTVATGVRATISPAGRGTTGSSSGGQMEVVEFKLTADPCDLTHLDVVVDATTAERYEVLWSLTTPGVAGLGHTVAGLRTITGRSAS